MKATKGAWHAKLSVAHQVHHTLWACHLNNWAWHASSSIQKGQSLWRATWYRRRATLAPNHNLGMPLEDPGVRRQTCRSQLKIGVPLEHQGVARQYNFPEKKLKVQALGRATWCRRRGTPALILTWACHLKTQAYHANIRDGQAKLGVPLGVEDVARQLLSSLGCAT
ncbi:hypothetical protein AHAS_Ahas19G0168700 [Arachis hypogaea]